MKMDPADAPNVARAYAELDRSRLPVEMGVTGRTLFHYHGLYFHLVEAPADSAGDLVDRIQARRDNPQFDNIAQRMETYLSPYVPEWRGLNDSRATEFYRWQAQQ